MREKMYKNYHVPPKGECCVGNAAAKLDCNAKCMKCLFSAINFKLHSEWYNSQTKVKRITYKEAFEVIKKDFYSCNDYLNATLEKHFGQKVEIIDE